MKTHDAIATAALVGFVTFLAGMFVGSAGTQSHYETEAINHGAAEYDSKTGEWRWIEKEVKE